MLRSLISILVFRSKPVCREDQQPYFNIADAMMKRGKNLGGGGGGGNLRVILVRVCEPVFSLKPTLIIYLGFEKNELFIYLMEQNVYIFIYCSLILYTFFAVCKQSLQIIITTLVSELNI